MVVDLEFLVVASGFLAQGGCQHILVVDAYFAVRSGVKIYEAFRVLEDEDQILA